MMLEKILMHLSSGKKITLLPGQPEEVILGRGTRKWFDRKRIKDLVWESTRKTYCSVFSVGHCLFQGNCSKCYLFSIIFTKNSKEIIPWWPTWIVVHIVKFYFINKDLLFLRKFEFLSPIKTRYKNPTAGLLPQI